MSKGQVVKVQGTTISASTSGTGTQAITAISKANPCVLTATGHSYVVGDSIRLSGIVGMTELNGGEYIVSAIATNSITLFQVDSTDYTTYVSGGVGAKGVFSNFCELKAFDRSGGASPEIETTTICSDAQEFETGLRAFGNLKLDYNFAPTVVVNTFDSAQETATPIIIKRVLPKNAGATMWRALVLETGESGEVNGVWQGSCTLKLTGSPFKFIPA
jgi:hypothetical protein